MQLWEHYSASEKTDVIQGFIDAICEMPANAVREQLTVEQMKQMVLALKQSTETLDKIVMIQKFAVFCAEDDAQKKPC